MASTRKLPRFRRGARTIAADDLNAIADAVEELRGILFNAGGGPGLSVGVSAGGLVIGLLGPLRDRLVTCKITAAPPAGVPVLPSACRYSYRGLDKKIGGDDVLPVYGREVGGDEVHLYPAEVGHLCFVFRNPGEDGQKTAELWVLTEKLVRGDC